MAAVLVAALGAGPARGQEPAAAAGAVSPRAGGLEFVHALADVSYRRLESAAAEHTYHVYVRVPADYDESDVRLPAVYLLDAGVTFPLIAGYQRYLESSEEVPKAILVGVSYGTNDWRQGNNRGHDFTAPSPEREHYGGAPDFQRMLRDELIPWVERHFRADPGRRVIFGQSLGGQFVLYTAQTEPRLFWGHIASNPALHRNLEFFLQPVAAVGDGGERSRLFVASGAEDSPRFRRPALDWMAHWTAVEAPPWELETVTLAGQTHFSAAPEAYRRGMAFFFPSPGEAQGAE